MPLDAASLHRRFSAEMGEYGVLRKVPPHHRRLPSLEGPRRGSEIPVPGPGPSARVFNPPIGNHPLRAHPVRKEDLSLAAGEANEKDSSGSYSSTFTSLK